MIPAEYFPSADLNCGKGPKKAVSGLYFLFLEADIISSVLEEEVSSIRTKILIQGDKYGSC